MASIRTTSKDPISLGPILLEGFTLLCLSLYWAFSIAYYLEHQYATVDELILPAIVTILYSWLSFGAVQPSHIQGPYARRKNYHVYRIARTMKAILIVNVIAFDPHAIHYAFGQQINSSIWIAISSGITILLFTCCLVRKTPTQISNIAH